MNLKNEFAEWFPSRAPNSYKTWYGNNLSGKLEDINEAYKASFEKSLFDIDISDISKEIKIIEYNILNRDKVKNNALMEYDNKASKGIPKAIIRNYFIGFLLEKYNDRPFIQKASKKSNDLFRSNSKKQNSRYKGNPIGNSQNLLIRNILSNIGNENITINDWYLTKQYFDNKCVYCGNENELVMDHAIPINKEKLGEHKIGNLLPVCKTCNQNKSDKDYKEFINAENTNTINKIEQYMISKNYIPLGDNDTVRKVLNMAHEEVALIAERYINIINELLIRK